MNILNILNTLNILLLRYSRYSSKILKQNTYIPIFNEEDTQDTQHIQDIRYSRFFGLNILEFGFVYRPVYWVTAPPYAGRKSFSPTWQARPGAVRSKKRPFHFEKLARFLRVLGVKNGCKLAQKSLIMVTDNYANCYYHNHEIQNPQKVRNNRLIQMINDLKRRFENVNSCLLVQGCKPKVALLARLWVHRLRYINLTERIVARLHEGINA